MGKIVIVEDDYYLAHSLKDYLQTKQIQSIVIREGSKAFSFLNNSNSEIDLVVLDIYLEDVNGLDICHNLRSAGFIPPIIFITNDQKIESLISAFERGADDYIRKPFSAIELYARIKRLTNQKPRISSIVQIQNISIDPFQRIILVDKKQIFVSRKQFDLLLFLAKNPNIVLSRDSIISNVWNFDDEPYHNTVDAHICAIRKAINDPEQKILETVHGVGYRVKSGS